MPRREIPDQNESKNSRGHTITSLTLADETKKGYMELEFEIQQRNCMYFGANATRRRRITSTETNVDNERMNPAILGFERIHDIKSTTTWVSMAISSKLQWKSGYPQLV